MVLKLVPYTPEPFPGPVNVMIDVETLGKRENAVILSIGAIVFDVQKDLGDGFYVEICPTKYPGSVDLDTIKFWMEQAAKGMKCPMGGTAGVAEAFTSLYDYLHLQCEGDFTRLQVWANGTDFDIPKLAYGFHTYGREVPWKYNSVRDARTIYKLFGDPYGIKPVPNEEKHNALADACWQAKWLISILRNLKEFVHVSEL